MNIHPAVYAGTNNGLSENDFIQSFQTVLTLNHVKNAYDICHSSGERALTVYVYFGVSLSLKSFF